MPIIKRAALALLCLVALGAWAKPGPGIMPKRGRGKPKTSFGGAILTRGPQYSDPNAPPPASAVPGLVAGTDPNNPNQVAAQGMGFSQSNCSGNIQSQVDALTAQLAGITAQLNGLLALERAEVAAEYACPPPAPPTYSTACQTGHANKALAYANQALVIGQQALPIAAQLQALQGQASACSGGGSSPQLNPPAVTLQAAAHRFGFSLPSAAGQGGSGSAFGPNSIFNGGSALEQLKELDAEGQGANWDNSRALGKALGGYARSAQRVAAMGPMVEAGKQVVKDGETYDDPKTQAEAEYLSINYKELGSKYDGLVDERHQAAETVADQTVSGLSPMAPIPDAQGKPLIEVASDALDQARDAAEEKAQETLVDKLKEGIIKLSPDGESMEKILNIQDKALSGVSDLFGKLGAAVDQMGSSSQATGDIEAAINAANKAGSDTGNEAGYQLKPPKINLFSLLTGGSKGGDEE